MYELPELEAAKSLRPDTSVPQVIYISRSFCQDRLGTNTGKLNTRPVFSQFSGQRPISLPELSQLPPALQPLMRHLVPDLSDEVVQQVLDRAAAAWEVNKRGFDRIGEAGLERANDHVEALGKL